MGGPGETLVIFSCLHSAVFRNPAPLNGELAFCIKCDDYKRVGKIPHTYIVNCTNCKKWAHRDYGTAFVTAETRAVQHSTRAPGHVVQLLEDDKIMREFYSKPLAINVDVPPF